MPELVKKLPMEYPYSYQQGPDLRPDPESHEVIHHTEKLAEYVPGRRGRKSSKTLPTPGYRLGEYIRQLIETRGLDRQHVADSLGVSRSTLDHLIAGYTRIPEIDHMKRLARTLGVSVFDIFAHTDIVEQRDIDFYLQSLATDSDLTRDANLSAALATMAQLAPANQKLVLQWFVTVIATMQAFHRNETNHR